MLNTRKSSCVKARGITSACYAALSSDWWDTPSSPWKGDTPSSPRLGGGIGLPPSSPNGAGYCIQSWMGVPLQSWAGGYSRVPPWAGTWPGWGYPHPVPMGVPIPSWPGTWPGWRATPHPDLGWGLPHLDLRWGYPPPDLGLCIPPGMGYCYLSCNDLGME